MSSKSASPVIRFIHRIAEAPAVENLSDGQLLEQFAVRRDEASFAALVQRHGPLVLSVCRRVLQHEADAEDAFQATFLVLVRKANAIDKRESVGSWLYGVAYRIAQKARASVCRRRQREQARAPLPESQPVDEAAFRELSLLLDEEVQRLPVKYRTPLVLCCLQGKTTEEAAKELGCARGTVGTHVARGRELLRARLARRGLALSTGLIVAALSRTAAAAMSPSLVGRTIGSALASAGNVKGAVSASPHVLYLVKGAMQAMMLTKMKLALAAALVVAVAGTGTGLVSYQVLHAGQTAQRKQDARHVIAGLPADDKNAKKDDEAGEEDPNRNVAADVQRSQNNLKQIGLAFYNFHDANGHFPTAAIYDKNGKALLSWRVALLPYLDGAALYQEFKLDEPWDSEHNKKLIAQMPSVFKAPGIKTKKPNTTYYQVIVGKGAMFEDMIQMKIANITDGTSNTILAIEGEKAVPWTKPEDLNYDPEKPLPKFGGVFAHGFAFLVADGSAQFCLKGFDEKKMRAAITRAGGEKVDLGNLQP